MKLAFIIDHLRPDGAQRMLRQLVEGLVRRGHQVSVFCLNDSFDAELLERIRSSGAGLTVIGKWRLLLAPGLVELYRRLRRGGFDVVVTVLFASDLVGRPVARMAGVRRVVTAMQTRDEFYSGLQRFLVRRTARFSDAWVLCSEEIRDFAINEEGAVPGRIEQIHNGIRTNEFLQPTAGAKIRAELELGEGVFLLGSLGRLTHQKGFDLLLSALAQLNGLDFRCVIAGTGEDEAGLKLRSADLALEGRVIFSGYRRDAPEFLSALDCYVQPSRYEGMPFAVLEAMASGRPIVATAVDGIKELIVHGEHGLLTEPGDPAGLAACIAAVAADREGSERMGAAARDRAVRMFDDEVITSRWEALLTGLAGKPGETATLLS